MAENKLNKSYGIKNIVPPARDIVAENKLNKSYGIRNIVPPARDVVAENKLNKSYGIRNIVPPARDIVAEAGYVLDELRLVLPEVRLYVVSFLIYQVHYNGTELTQHTAAKRRVSTLEVNHVYKKEEYKLRPLYVYYKEGFRFCDESQSGRWESGSENRPNWWTLFMCGPVGVRAINLTTFLIIFIELPVSVS